MFLFSWCRCHNTSISSTFDHHLSPTRSLDRLLLFLMYPTTTISCHTIFICRQWCMVVSPHVSLALICSHRLRWRSRNNIFLVFFPPRFHLGLVVREGAQWYDGGLKGRSPAVCIEGVWTQPRRSLALDKSTVSRGWCKMQVARWKVMLGYSVYVSRIVWYYGSSKIVKKW